MEDNFVFDMEELDSQEVSFEASSSTSFGCPD
jgi:hypothetical protein